MVKLSLSKFQSFLQDSFLERDIQNEDNITNFIEECSEEDTFIISKIKSTFPCWSKESAIEVSTQERILNVTRSFIIYGVFLYLIIILPLGYIVENATNIAFDHVYPLYNGNGS